MEKPEVTETIIVAIRSTEVLLGFDKALSADQFREWWEQEGWDRFMAWSEERL